MSRVTVKTRMDQILAWLMEERPCGRKVEIIWVNWTSKENKDYFGSADRVGDVLKIKLSNKKCRQYSIALDTLIHEYAHCRLWGPAKTECSEKIEDHDPAFWAEYGIIYNMFHYGDGWLESKEYHR